MTGHTGDNGALESVGVPLSLFLWLSAKVRPQQHGVKIRPVTL